PKQRSGSERTSIYNQIREAVANHRVLRIVFTARDGTTTTRDIEPLELTGTNCVAYCRLRRGLRTFRMGALSSANLTGEIFVPEPSQSATEGSVPNLPRAARGQRNGIRVWVWIAAVVIGIALLRSCHG